MLSLLASNLGSRHAIEVESNLCAVYNRLEFPSAADKMAHLLTGNKFSPNEDIPDLSEKVYVVTGGTAGIGFGITAHLLQHGAARIILLSQKEEHADKAKRELEKYGNTSKVEWRQIDLKDLSQTDRVAKQLAEEQRIDGVCNCDSWNMGNLANTLIACL